MTLSKQTVANAESLLLVAGVDCFYGQAQALFAVDLEVRAAEAVALVGRNGAGKSTLLQTIGGLLRPTAGSIRFAGHEIGAMAPHRLARLGIGTVPEGRRIFGALTVAENLEVGRRPSRSTPILVDLAAAMVVDDAPAAPQPADWTVAGLLDLFPALGPLMQRRGDTLSGGEQQMLAIARALMGNPRLLLLDEPTEGLDPAVVEQTSAAVRAIKAKGVAILLSEQNPVFLAGLVDRATLIERGRLTRL